MSVVSPSLEKSSSAAHMQAEHPLYFAKVQGWLRNVDKKIDSLEVAFVKDHQQSRPRRNGRLTRSFKNNCAVISSASTCEGRRSYSRKAQFKRCLMQ